MTITEALEKKARTNIVVLKFGGTSVATPELIKAVARKVVNYVDRGKKVAVVVSAMGDTTDRLVDLAYQVSSNPDKREMDMLLSTGEQISISLLAMAIKDLGYEAISMTGYQAGIKTDGVFTKAKIAGIDRERILKELEKGKIVIVAGFQGIDEEMNITTLGRGGSDTSAVAVGAAVGADYVEIYTDVPGVFTADPRIVPTARKIDFITYDEMLELARLGAKVLQVRSVEFAKRYGVPIHVRSTFSDEDGTLVADEEFLKEIGGDAMEQPVVRGVTAKSDEVRITLKKVPDRPGVAAEIFDALASKEINVNLIVQSSSTVEAVNDVSFTINESDYNQAKEVVDELLEKLNAEGVDYDTNIAIVSIVGVGMRSHPGVAATMFRALAEKGINIQMISTSEITISCVIDRARASDATRAIHSAFGLDES